MSTLFPAKLTLFSLLFIPLSKLFPFVMPLLKLLQFFSIWHTLRSSKPNTKCSGKCENCVSLTPGQACVLTVGLPWQITLTWPRSTIFSDPLDVCLIGSWPGLGLGWQTTGQWPWSNMVQPVHASGFWVTSQHGARCFGLRHGRQWRSRKRAPQSRSSLPNGQGKTHGQEQ